MNVLPQSCGDRLAKLIPLLATDHDGEVVATVRAIGRTLTAAGADFHVLASTVTRSPAAQPINSRHGTGSWRAAAQRGHEHRERLSERERAFIDDLVGRSFGRRVPSDRQIDWLCAIYNRVIAGGRS